MTHDCSCARSHEHRTAALRRVRRFDPCRLLRQALPVLLMALWFSMPASLSAQPAEPWLQGAMRAVSGEHIGYHSALPDADAAILVRSLRSENFIEWETEPVPEDVSGARLTFVWLAGYDSTADRRQWRLDLEGEPWFTFSNETDQEWAVAGPYGSELRYVRSGLDRHGDAQGFHFLTLPTDRVVKGRSLRLRVTGESAGARTWYMVFLHELASGVKFAAEPAVLKQGDRRRQRIRVDITHIGPPGRAEISVDGAAPVSEPVRLGFQRVFVPVDAVDRPETKRVSVTVGEAPAALGELVLEPVRPFEVWFLPHSHVDIGYTHGQEEVLKLQWRNLEQAIDLARRTESYPEGARFKWNAEVMWVVDEYLRRQPEARVKALVDAVRNGWIGLDGLYGNQLTGLERAEELFRAAGENVRDLTERYGFEVKSAMISDVPGYSWGLVPAFAHNGIRYFSVGPNRISGLPHGGDRVGYTLEAWGDKPFWWEGPDGSRVLLWMSGQGYSGFHAANLGSLGTDSASDLLQHLLRLDESGYPYDIVQLRYTIGGDNGPPDERMPDFVREWNARYETPTMRIATTRELFEAFEGRYGDQLPIHRGELSPYWEDGAGSSARETAMNRWTADRLVQAEALWAQREPSRAPIDQLRQAWQNVLLYSEHTWGAHNSISEPESPFVTDLWNGKKAYAEKAARLADELLALALEAPAVEGVDVSAVEIVNTTSWPRTDLVSVPAAWRLRGDVVVGPEGEVLPSQRLSTGELAFLADGVPAFGSRVFTLRTGPPAAAPAEGWATTDGLGNGRLTVRLDPLTGAVASLAAEGLPYDLVSSDVHRGLNAYLYSGQNAAHIRANRDAKVEVVDAGPLVYTVRVAGPAPGARALVQEIRLIEGLDRVDWTNEVEKTLVVDKENVRFAFPFRIPDAQVRLDVPWGILRPDLDQLEGANKNYFSVERFVDLSNDTHGLQWVTLDAPLVELGGPVGEAWMSDPTRPWERSVPQTDLVYSWVMNNSWHTNYRAGQDGRTVFRYALRTHGPFDPAEAKRFAIERSQPLLVKPATEGTSARPSFFTVEPAGEVLVTGLRPSRDGRARIVRLFNASDETQTVNLSSAANFRVYRSDVTERRGSEIGTRRSGPLTLGAGEIVTLRIP